VKIVLKYLQVSTAVVKTEKIRTIRLVYFRTRT